MAGLLKMRFPDCVAESLPDAPEGVDPASSDENRPYPDCPAVPAEPENADKDQLQRHFSCFSYFRSSLSPIPVFNRIPDHQFGMIISSAKRYKAYVFLAISA
ncbi:hypothetical protein JJJ17_19525 [Paracoccus caeni]|uniref:Uncharacterized protein n=1 Tax=Paracoccus caeni TaxID=657651 RepID=A0A934SI78_9RHOB|nr:hypothetical protein [Paracoccus caeni]MBK4218123.1 hypothetical protein [Paracoccus caeni]